MALGTLVKAVERYLEQERAILAAAADPDVGEKAEKLLAPARRELEKQVGQMRALAAAPRAFGKIVVAIDESQQADWALQTAVRMAAGTGAELALVHAIPEPGSVSPELAYAEPAIRARTREAAEELVNNAAARVPEGISKTVILHEGAAPPHICAAAREWEADLIVIGTHGRSMIGRLLLGGTAEAVVRHAHCPVLTVAHAPAPATRLSQEPALQTTA